MFIFSGMRDMRSPSPIVNALHTAALSTGIPSSLNESTKYPIMFPSITVKRQFSNKNPRNTIPRMSDDSKDENTKKDTIMNGVRRNPTYNKGNKFIVSYVV